MVVMLVLGSWASSRAPVCRTESRLRIASARISLILRTTCGRFGYLCHNTHLCSTVSATKLWLLTGFGARRVFRTLLGQEAAQQRGRAREVLGHQAAGTGCIAVD